MRKWAVLTRAHPWVSVVAALGLFSIAWLVVAGIPLSNEDDVIGDVAELHDWFQDQQLRFLLILPPADEPFLQPGYPDVLPFDPVGYPKALLENLPGDIEFGVPIYTVYLVEDAATRAFVIFNRDNEPIWSVNPPVDYDPYAYAKERFPGLETGVYSPEATERILSALDPARLQIAVRLIPDEFYTSYVAARKANLSATLLETGSGPALSSLGGGGMAMMNGGSSSGLWVSAEGPADGLTNEVVITVHLPDGFTDRVDVFSVDTAEYDGADTVWYVVATNLQTSGTNIVVWTNTPAYDADLRFFTAGTDFDEDGDGLSSAREILTYKSSATDIDSDNDGFVDGFDGLIGTNTYTNGVDSDLDGFVDGEIENGTDPMNDDVNPPTVTIERPAAGYNTTWIP